MSHTFKHKLPHIIYTDDNKLNIRIPLKLRWRIFNKWRRHNHDWDLDRAELSYKREQAANKDMRLQVKDL